MVQVSSHPLLSLPEDKIVQKLRKMSIEEILKFSLISKRCKDLVTSIQIRGVSFRVRIGSDIKVSIGTKSRRVNLFFYREPDMYWEIGANGRKKKLTTPRSVLVGVTKSTNYHGGITSEWKNDSTMKDWLKHLQDIFNYHKTDSIGFTDDSPQFDIDEIKEVFGSITDVHIEDTGSYAFNQMTIQKFFPIERLNIEINTFQNSKVPGSLLLQNFSVLNIYDNLNEQAIITLDDLLLINSKVIAIGNFDILPKQLNKFIKLWQKRSNPHMEYLQIDSMNHTEDDPEIILKGIKHEVVPVDQKRKFKIVGLDNPDVINGGYDFYRIDGVKATIQFKYVFAFIIVKMHVWFDHCVVE